MIDIKKCCKYAEGWKYKKIDGLEDRVKSPDGNVMLKEDYDSKDWETLYYPLLLQSVIEGINREHLNDDKYPSITIDSTGIRIGYPRQDYYDNVIDFDDYDSIIEAKESVINYVMGAMV